MISGIILLKGLVAALIVGFMTASIKSWVDRIFLVIMLVGIVGLPIAEAMIVNLGVVAFAALLVVRRINTCPLWKSMMVGMPVMFQREAKACFFSVSTLTVRIRPLYSPANRCMTGETILQGPHQSA